METPKMNIKVADFEGPFDLLLHLIKKNKMDIYNVEIFKITSQYLEYLDAMKKMDLEITSEFIVIAATLIEIKSKSLLPKHKAVEEEDEEDIEKVLFEKLIVYKKIKASTQFFREKSWNIGCTYGKKAEIIEVKKEKLSNDDLFENITLIDLYNIYNDLIENYSKKMNRGIAINERNIKRDDYKIEDKYSYILSVLGGEPRRFSDIISECSCKLECIVTFLALLELIKQRRVHAYQNSSFGEIIIKEISEEEEQDEYKSI